MRTREDWFEAERLKAEKFGIARNTTGLGWAGLIGVQWADDLMPNVELVPNHSPLSYIVLALGSAAAVATYKLHLSKRESESSALKAAAYEVKEFVDTPYTPGEWATEALAEAHLTADEITQLPYGSVVKPKRAS